MIRVSKKQVDELRKHGVRNGENGIYTTKGHHKSWYMAETPYNMKTFNKFCK